MGEFIMYIRAKLFGYMLGDGWIDIKGNGGFSGERQSLKLIANDIDLLYGPNSTGKIRTEETYSSLYDIHGTTSQMTVKTKVIRDMLNLGMPQGKRVVQKYVLPFWIINGSHEIKISFLSGYYAADGMIPSLQINNETPKPLMFSFYKSKDLEDNGDILAKQYRDIVADIGFDTSLKKINKFTGGPRIEYRITIHNERDLFLKQLQCLDLSYCQYREQRRLQLISYLSFKRQKIDEMNKMREQVFFYKQQGKTYKQIQELTGLAKHNIDAILYGRNKGHRIVGFPKFNEYLHMCSSLKTPLNDESPDITDILG